MILGATGTNLLTSYGIPGAAATLGATIFGGLIWLLKYQAAQIKDMGAASVALAQQATAAMTSQAETNRTAAAALASTSQDMRDLRDEVRTLVTVLGQQGQNGRRGGSRGPS